MASPPSNGSNMPAITVDGRPRLGLEDARVRSRNTRNVSDPFEDDVGAAELTNDTHAHNNLDEGEDQRASEFREGKRPWYRKPSPWWYVFILRW